jgi:leucyl aminopeptidase
MKPSIIHSIEAPKEVAKVFLAKEIEPLRDFGFSEEELQYIQNKKEKKASLVSMNLLGKMKFVRFYQSGDDQDEDMEAIRKDGHAIQQALKSEKESVICCFDLLGDQRAVLALTEGLALSAYSFNKYKTEDKDEFVLLEKILVVSPKVSPEDCEQLQNVCNAVLVTRNLVNEPVATLDVKEMAKTVQELGKEHAFSVEVLNKAKIEALKMGGLLAVNKGSQDPPAFIIMEWKPETAANEKPIVLVGKGIVFDTGGINLKTMAGSLDDMKCDMGGAAAVIGAMAATAANKLPIHLIGLVPATDNRPGFNAYVPGDVLTMYNGKTVEVINTDAEGRLILADALSYADKYEPELVIDLATLTGSAMMAIGQYGTVGMGTAASDVFDQLLAAGARVHERVVRFPFWKEYDELIKSQVADIKNLGGREAGAITAGKFLSHFTTHPWVHLDIAGPAFVHKEDSYRGTGGTGVGVRLLYEFLCEMARR